MTTEAELGKLRNIFHGTQPRNSEIIIIILWFVLFSMIPFLIGIYRATYGYAQYGLVAAKSWGNLWLITSATFLFLIICYVFYRYLISNLSISLHYSGIRVKKLFRNDLIILWDQVSELYIRQESNLIKTKSIRTLCLIHTTDNKKFLLRSSFIENAIELITQIKSSVYTHLYPRIQQTYQNDKVLSFGPIKAQKKYVTLSRYCFNLGVLKIPWKDIDLITIKSGYLQIKLHNRKQYRYKVSKIPNIELLLKLIDIRTSG